MMANQTEYGLAGYFFTKDLARAWRVAEELEYGMQGGAFGGEAGGALCFDYIFLVDLKPSSYMALQNGRLLLCKGLGAWGVLE